MTDKPLTPEELATNIIADCISHGRYDGFDVDYEELNKLLTQYTAAIRQAAIDECLNAVPTVKLKAAEFNNVNEAIDYAARGTAAQILIAIQNLKSQPAEKGE